MTGANLSEIFERFTLVELLLIFNSFPMIGLISRLLVGSKFQR